MQSLYFYFNTCKKIRVRPNPESFGIYSNLRCLAIAHQLNERLYYKLVIKYKKRILVTQCLYNWKEIIDDSCEYP